MADKLRKGIDEIIARNKQNAIDNEIPKGTPINMPEFSVWGKPMGKPWVVHSGRDTDKDFNKYAFARQNGYNNAMIIPNGLSPKEYLDNVDDYEAFNQLYYPAWKKGRDNYLEGEEEDIWNDLSEYFEMPKYEANKYGFTVNDKDKIVNLLENGIPDGLGFGGWKRKPKDLGQLKRRIYK